MGYWDKFLENKPSDAWQQFLEQKRREGLEPPARVGTTIQVKRPPSFSSQSDPKDLADLRRAFDANPQLMEATILGRVAAMVLNGADLDQVLSCLPDPAQRDLARSRVQAILAQMRANATPRQYGVVVPVAVEKPVDYTPVIR